MGAISEALVVGHCLYEFIEGDHTLAHDVVVEESRPDPGEYIVVYEWEAEPDETGLYGQVFIDPLQTLERVRNDLKLFAPGGTSKDRHYKRWAIFRKLL